MSQTEEATNIAYRSSQGSATMILYRVCLRSQEKFTRNEETMVREKHTVNRMENVEVLTF